MRLPLLKSCNGVLAHIEEKCPVSGVHLNFAKKQKTAQLSGLFNEEKLRGMMEERKDYANDAAFPFDVALIDRSLGFFGEVRLESDESAVQQDGG